jgi:hypothetical protein
VTLLIVLALVTVLAVWWQYELKPRRDARREAQRARLAECAARGHDWGEPFNAMDDPAFPMRRCRRCRAHDFLVKCTACGKPVRKEDGTLTGCDRV